MRSLVWNHVRWTIRRDVPGILKIDKGLSEEQLLAWLRRRDVVGMVAADHRDKPLGYMVYQLSPHNLRLIRMTVSQHHRRQRVGTSLLDKLLTKLTTHKRKSLVVEAGEECLNDLCPFLARRANCIHPVDGGVRFVFFPEDSDGMGDGSYRQGENQLRQR